MRAMRSAVTHALWFAVSAGSWWLEYHRLHRLQAAEALAAAGGKVLSIPCGFAAGHELLRDTEREHCR